MLSKAEINCVDADASNTGEWNKHMGSLENVGCLSHFSHCLVKIPDQSNATKEELVRAHGWFKV